MSTQTHSSILAWRIPWTEELGRLQSVHGVAKSPTWLSTHVVLYLSKTHPTQRLTAVTTVCFLWRPWYQHALGSRAQTSTNNRHQHHLLYTHLLPGTPSAQASRVVSSKGPAPHPPTVPFLGLFLIRSSLFFKTHLKHLLLNHHCTWDAPPRCSHRPGSHHSHSNHVQVH